MFEEKSKCDETKPIKRDNLLDNVHYATVLAFCDKFSKHLPEVRKLNINSIEEILTREDLTGDRNVAALHLSLLRKLSIGKLVKKKDKWESYLVKFLKDYVKDNGLLEDIGATSLETQGYPNLSSEQKLKILNCLLEAQFDENQKFKQIVNDLIETSSASLRSEPEGEDRNGCNYWLFVDRNGLFRLFVQSNDESGWKIKARNIDEFKRIIENLRVESIISNEIEKKQEQENRQSSKSTRSGQTRAQKSIAQQSNCIKWAKKITKPRVKCKECDAQFHSECLDESDDSSGLCPMCKHKRLVIKLEEKLTELECTEQIISSDSSSGEDEEDSKMCQHKVRPETTPASIKIENQNHQPGKRTRSCRLNQINYTFDQFDKTIIEATGGMDMTDDELENESEKNDYDHLSDAESDEINTTDNRDENLDETDENENDDEEYVLTDASDNESAYDSSDNLSVKINSHKKHAIVNKRRSKSDLHKKRMKKILEFEYGFKSYNEDEYYSTPPVDSDTPANFYFTSDEEIFKNSHKKPKLIIESE